MKLTWKYEREKVKQIIHLYEGKVYYSKKFGEERFYEKELTFQEFFALKYPLLSVVIDSFVYKKAVEQPKPTDLGEKESKRWDFWAAIDLDKIKKKEYFFEQKRFWLKSKKGFAEGYIWYTGEEFFSSWQSIDDFFFYGPYFWGVSLRNRKKIKQEIFDSLDKTKSNLTLEDSFLIFDYKKIEKINFEKIDGMRGSYFKIIDGKVIVGGWDNHNDGGENYTSVEYLWYNLKSRVPKEFHDKIPYIKSVLVKAILNPKGKEGQEDLPPSG